jgi:predicted DNA binding CopG/RHH family protein
MEDRLGEMISGEMDEEESARFAVIEEQGERDAEQEIREQRMNVRWTKMQVDLVRRAAAIYGITYQTYLKQAAVRQALADLKTAREACPELVSKGERPG